MRLALCSVLICTAIVLQGCDAVGNIGFLSNPGGKSADLATSMPMAKGEVLISAPAGYCIDPGASRNRKGLVVMARCDTLGGTDLPAYPPLGLITVSVTEQASDSAAPTVEELAALSAGGKIVRSHADDDLVLVNLSEGHTLKAAVDDQHWRGAFALNGHLVVLGLYATEHGAAAGSAGAPLLMELTKATRKASPQS